jgi:uncharacterized protein
MSTNELISPRRKIPTGLLILCLAISACAHMQAGSDKENNNQAAYDKAAKDLNNSAQVGDSSAQNALGLLYFKGHGGPPNSNAAKRWFEKAAEQGHAGAQVNLGTLYLHGDGAEQSYQMALFWFNRAAQQGQALAFAKLGRMYELGRGVPKDLIQAHMWYNLSVAHGERRATQARDALANRMNPAQIAESDRLAREWKPKANRL